MRTFGLAILLLSACLAVSFADEAGEAAEVGSRRLLTRPYRGPPKYPKECRFYGDSGDGRGLAKCCYQNGYKDKDYIYNICKGFGINIDVTVIVTVITPLGYTPKPRYTGPPVVPDQCTQYGYSGSKDDLVKCCWKYGVHEPQTIYDICHGYSIEIDITIIITIITPLGYRPKPTYNGPSVVPDQCTQYGYSGSKDDLVKCCWKYGVHEPQTIYDICQGYSIEIQITIIIDIITPLGYHPPPPSYPPQCGRWANKGNYKKFVKCCKKANRKPKDIVVYCKTVPTIEVDITIAVVQSISVAGPIEDAG